MGDSQEGDDKKAQGNAALKRGDFQAAIRCYTAALLEVPSGPGSMAAAATLHSNLSAARAHAGDYLGALTDADSAVALRPDWVKAHTRRALALLKMGRNQEAVAAYQNAARCDPDNAEVLAALSSLGLQPAPPPASGAHGADAREAGGDAAGAAPAEAAAAQRTAARRTSQPTAAVEAGAKGGKRDGRVLGNEAFKAGNFAEALEWYTRTIAEHPRDHRLFTNRATCNLKLGNFPQALLDANRAIELHATWARAWLRLAQALTGMGEYANAEALLAKATDRMPEERDLFDAALLEVAAARKSALIPRIAPASTTTASNGVIQIQGSRLEYEEYPLHPAAILDAEGNLPEEDEPGTSPVNKFVVPVALPACMQPLTPSEESELALMRPAWRASKKFVLVIPIEGLANRLRVVVDALQLAEDMCRALLLCWQPAPACQCRWEDLFEDHPLITVIEQPVVPSGASRMECAQPPEALLQWREVAQKRYVDDPTRYAEYDEADYLVFGTSEEFYPGGAAHSKDTGLKWIGMSGDPDHPMRKSGSRWLNTLKVRPRIKEMVQRLPPFACGVHIRCTDNINSWHSPIDLFFKAMEARIDNDARTRFFLATDDPSVEKMVFERYGTLVQVYPKRNYNRRNRVAIEDALVDLLHLAQTEEIIGRYQARYDAAEHLLAILTAYLTFVENYWSAYTEVASWFRMQPLRVVYRPLEKMNTKQVLMAIHERVMAASKYPW